MEELEDLYALVKIFEIKEVFERDAEKAMGEEGGMNMRLLKNILGLEYPIYLDRFEQEVEQLVEERLLISHGTVWKVYEGNLPKGGGVKDCEGEIERRPDKVIVQLAKEGQFHSLVIA